jgi:predicted acetyltransferase
MPRLLPPAIDVQASFLTAVKEFRAEGRGGADDSSMLGRDIYQNDGRWDDPGQFASYVSRLRADALEESPRREGHVPGTTLWWVDDEEYLGRLTIRHRLTAHLREVGGHIGYDVRPSARRRGHATAMLAAALPVARRLGIDPALITCDEDNVASRKVIVANGGILEDTHSGKLRYWVPTS